MQKWKRALKKSAIRTSNLEDDIEKDIIREKHEEYNT